MTSPNRLRIPVLAVAAIALGLAVVGGILLVGRVGVPDATPSPTIATSPAPTATPTPVPTDPLSTPEGAARAFFDAYSAARRTDDPAAVASLVTGTESSAYLSVAGFLAGQKALGKASVVTIQRLDNLATTIDGDTATVTFDYTEGGYDIDLASASPLESPQVLPAYRVTVSLQRVAARWLVDAYTSRP